MQTYQRGQRATLVSLGLSLALCAIKLAAGIFGNAFALIADAAESTVDVVASALVWQGLRVAQRPADAEHPYGHGKAEALAALIVAGIIAAVGIGIAAGAVQNLMTPHPGPAAWTLAVLAGVIVIKELLYRGLSRTARDINSHAVHADAWHHRSDAITSALAAIGILIAVVGGKGWEYADELAGLAASGVILVTAWRLLHGPLAELMDAAPLSLLDQIRDVASRCQGVERVEKLLARKSGLHYWVDMHLEVDPAMTVAIAHDVAHRVKDQIRAAIPQVIDVLIHVEPACRPPEAESPPVISRAERPQVR